MVVILPDSVTITLPELLLNWVVVSGPDTVTSAAKAGTAVNPLSASKPMRQYLTCEMDILTCDFLLKL